MAEQLPIEDHSGASTLIESLWDGKRYGDVPEHWAHAANVLHGAYMLADSVSVQSDISFLKNIARQRSAMAKAVQQ